MIALGVIGVGYNPVFLIRKIRVELIFKKSKFFVLPVKLLSSGL